MKLQRLSEADFSRRDFLKKTASGIMSTAIAGSPLKYVASVPETGLKVVKASTPAVLVKMWSKLLPRWGKFYARWANPGPDEYQEAASYLRGYGEHYFGIKNNEVLWHAVPNVTVPLFDPEVRKAIEEIPGNPFEKELKRFDDEMERRRKEQREQNEPERELPPEFEKHHMQRFTKLEWLYSKSPTAILEYIRKIGPKKWRVYSHKGKNMGTYESQAGAKKRLAQVEYFKSRG